MALSPLPPRSTPQSTARHSSDQGVVLERGHQRHRLHADHGRADGRGVPPQRHGTVHRAQKLLFLG